MDICIDFDGTCVTHEYPFIGAEIGAVPVLKKLVNKGHNLIIFTMRSGEKLNEAYEWFRKNNISVYGIQENPTQKLWTSSPKAYGHLYIDDATLGIPLSQDKVELLNGRKIKPKRPYVDWVKVEQLLINKSIL